MCVVFENRILDIKDQMSTEFLFRAGVQIKDILCRASNPINLHQFVTEILSS